MTVRQQDPLRIQQIEADLAALRSKLVWQPGRIDLPPQVRIAKTVAVSPGSYPETGNTFALIFRDELYNEAEGDNPLTGLPQDAEFQRYGHTIPPDTYIPEGTWVFVVDIDGQMYIIAAANSLGWTADCIAETEDATTAAGSTVVINKQSMLQLARLPGEIEPVRPILQIRKGPTDSVLWTGRTTDQAGTKRDQIFWTQGPSVVNLILGGWLKLARPSIDQGDPDNQFWIGPPGIGQVARYKLPPRPSRSHQYLIAGGVTNECVQMDWHAPGVNCEMSVYDCSGEGCWNLTFLNGLLVNAQPPIGENCPLPDPVPDIFGCLDVAAIDFNPCLNTAAWQWLDSGQTTQHVWSDGIAAAFSDV